MKKNKQVKNPFENLFLDAYEQEIEDSVPENFKLPKVPKKEKDEFSAIASRHKLLRQSKRINIRINNEDLARVKAKAKVNSIPYQTLLGTLIHKYAKNDFKVAL